MSNIQISDDEFSKLKELVVKARDGCYAPYSKFRVGAVILTADGEYVLGGNIENASYGATICAERTACVKAVSEFHRKFKAMAVITDLETIASPCGICRQFIREFASLSMPLYMFNKDCSKYEMLTVDQLLPKSFGPDDLAA